MTKAQEILELARNRKQAILSEYESKRLLSAYGIPVVSEAIVKSLNDAKKAAYNLGYPVALKLCAPELTHKTEKRLIRLNLLDELDLEKAFQSLKEQVESLGGEFLIQKMINGVRELVIGMILDPQFGPCLLFGLGGIFTEALKDVSFRVAPIKKHDALEMMREIRGHEILDAFRGMEPVDLEALSESLIALGQIGLENSAIHQIDVNPMIVQGRQPIAVDALVVLKEM